MGGVKFGQVLGGAYSRAKTQTNAKKECRKWYWRKKMFGV